MFIGFDLHISKDAGIFRECESYSDYVELGKFYFEGMKKDYQQDLMEYITAREIDGTKIQNEWFPTIDADIFISHSHMDEELACALAGWIYETFRLKCFIDSCVWGYSSDLLEAMNSKLSNKRSDGDGGYLYNHTSCNQVSQHVNVMLSSALQKMIDKVEAVILMNTDNSISVHTDSQMNKTYSPWIYSEIMSTQLIRKKPLIAYRNYSSKYYRADDTVMLESLKHAMQFSISYQVSLKHLVRIGETELRSWKEECYERGHVYEYELDALYKFMCPGEVEHARQLFSSLSGKEVQCIKQYFFAESVDEHDRIESERVLQRIFDKWIAPCWDCDRLYIGRESNEKDGG